MDDIPDLVEELPDDPSVFKANNIDYLAVSSKIPDSVPSNVGKKVPITIVTGYLGSGKSTLLQQIGKTSKKRLAIILNEFGDSATIEKSVTIKDHERNEAVQEWLDLGNGCLCCTVKDNGVVAIEQLIEKSKDKIDYILLETTGIADPAPIAKMFWLDEGLGSNVYIDGVITVLDSEHILTCLDDVGGHWHASNNHLKISQSNNDDLTEEEIQQEQEQLREGLTTAHLQIALADVVLLNKIDILEKNLESKDSKIKQIEQKIRSINTTCPIYTTSFGDISLDNILDLHAFEANTEKIQKSIISTNGSSFHDYRISTITLNFPFFNSEDGFSKLEKFLQFILWEHTVNGKEIEIHRSKGVLVYKSADKTDVRVIQGVRETYDIIKGGLLLDDIQCNKLVFIGKNLNEKDFYDEMSHFL